MNIEHVPSEPGHARIFLSAQVLIGNRVPLRTTSGVGLFQDMRRQPRASTETTEESCAAKRLICWHSDVISPCNRLEFCEFRAAISGACPGCGAARRVPLAQAKPHAPARCTADPG